MSAAAVAVVLAAVALDGAVGEPPNALHPVAWFGSAVALADREFGRPRVAGAAVAFALPLTAAAVAGGAVALAGVVHGTLAVLVATLGAYATTSRRMLLALARDVVAASEDDLDAARRDLRGLAGRDASALSPALVRSAAVESAAENLADGLVAPLGAFVVGALAGGAAFTGSAALGGSLALAAGVAAAAWVKAVNTLDSMLGYPGKRHGTASARLDDAVMWLPARASALLIALAGGRPGALAAARRWLDGVPSPNSGWPMGALAAAVGVRLEKPGVYALNPDEPLPPAVVARRAIAIVDRAGWLAVASAVAVAFAVPTGAVDPAAASAGDGALDAAAGPVVTGPGATAPVDVAARRLAGVVA